MEDANLVEKHYRDTTSFAFADYRTKPTQDGLDVLPGDVCAGRVCVDCFQSSLMGALHAHIVPDDGTERNAD